MSSLAAEWLSQLTLIDGMDFIENQLAILDRQGHIVTVNNAWKDFQWLNNTLPPAEQGTHYINFLEKSGKKDAGAKIKAVLEGRSVLEEHPYSCHSPKGNRWFVMKVMPVEQDGSVVGALVRHENVTEIELYKQETAVILESMTDAFYSVDDDWRFTYVNKGAASILGKSKEELIGKRLLEALPEAENTEIMTVYEKAMRTRENVHFESYYPPFATWFELYVYPRKKGGLSIYFKNIDERKKTEMQLRQAAYFDELTNLPNRRFFIENLQSSIQMKKKDEMGCAVLFMDLDGFKNINDTLGHDTGDILLKEVGTRLRNQAGADHFVGRLGGDEFLIIYRGETNDEDVLQFAEQLLNIVRVPVSIDQNTILNVTASIGASLYPVDGNGADELMRKADMAMYQAKKLKGNRAILFHDELHQHLERRLYIEEKLKKAADNEEIFFVYQPQVDGRTGDIIGFEVLSRWKSRRFGWISPVEFINIAEESGYIADLTKKMMKESFRFFRNIREKFGFEGFLAVNLSSKLLTDEAFITDFKRFFRETGLSKDSVEIEITESVPIFSSKAVSRNLQLLRQEGICVAIDDFGTGYSALSYLHDFPLDKIKVDKSFVDQIEKSSRGEALLKSILHLADNLNIKIMAEGVETGRQRDWLIANDCYRIQGYYYYRPLQMNEVENLFQS
ncbi:hypothetical protein BTO30_11620 [Domibacillus antri]|uniref:GGDEF domain-containing protein n=1 Tax=Domibacillus antri TaxID=1714264 RepID=A0A1Q8Q3Z5_9BACI|nr:EAL domain-containing protein [Domibacillus antri]OLN22060.1 hypothetical protein BTO30_11620 [Domibacillus antri]